MLKWVKKSKPDSKKMTTLALSEVETSLVSASLWAAQAIGDGWRGATGEEWAFKDNFAVRIESLAFFTSVMNRYAFLIAPAARDAIQDYITPRAIEAVAVNSFDTSGAKSGFDVGAWKSKLQADCLDALNEAEIDFATCTSLSDPSGFLREASLLGKASARVARAANYDLPQLRLLAASAFTDALANSELKRETEEAARTILSS